MDDSFIMKRMETSSIIPDGTKPLPLGSGTIVSRVGEGGVAVVYEIFNKELGISRAVKLLRNATDANTLQRFNTEMSITAQLRHPNIVEIHSVGEWNGLPYIEMELIDGESLSNVIALRGALPLHVCTAIGIMVCRALDFTHNQEYVYKGKTYPGILHRDLKPQNIMIEKNGAIKLMDFGTATPTNISLNTIDGTFVGSLLYVAPEQLLGGHGDECSDLYSLGCVLYEMITGRKVFPEVDISKLMSDRGKNKYEPVNSFNVKIPRALRKLVDRCLLKDSNKRIQNAKSILAELENIHKRTTRFSPEEVVKQFIESEPHVRSVLERYRFSTLTGTIIIVTTSMFLFFTALLLINLGLGLWGKEKTVPVEKQVVVPLKQKIDTTAVESVIKSVRSKPRVKKPRRIPTVVQPPVVQPPYRAWPQLVLGRKVGDPAGLLEMLKGEYRTQDMLMILSGELHKGHFIQAWHTYEAVETMMRVGRMKTTDPLSVTVSEYKRQLESFFRTNTAASPEFYLVKARMSYTRHDHQTASVLLQKAQTVTSTQQNDAVSRTIAYYKALAISECYRKSHTDSLKTAAITSWSDVKTAFASVQDRRYVHAAGSQIAGLTAQ